ncbi:hypothetical protein [Caulobacter sp. NIBR2454]|uniref:hypothetical protein n=1 Tax=Caulobacter sp. NIBR2454 TaxID=3015996 RepID=UPI0022B6B36A|nr:hypothetical protein [Caulobacter sp. NIBR2454]
MTPEIDYRFHDPLPRRPGLDDGAIPALYADDTVDEDEDLDDEEDEDEQATDANPLPPSRLDKEKQLDHGLKETFPASDPVSINPGAD